MLSIKYRITIFSLLTILAFGTFVPALAYAAPMANSDKDWQYTQGNSWAWNYSPQNQINKNNVDQLEVKWVAPLAVSANAPAYMKALNAGEGSTTPVIIHDGVAYLRTNWLNTYAFDAKTGKQLWSHQYKIDVNATKERLPVSIAAPHQHGFRYWEKQNVLLLSGMACEFYALDAKTGEEKFTVGPLCKDVPGSVNTYGTFGSMMAIAQLGTYEKGNVFVGAVAYADLGVVKSGRTAIIGVDMNNPSQILWRVFTMPPQDRPIDDWALQNCDVGFFNTVPCSDVKAKAPDNLMNDWQYKPGQVPHWSTGVTANWGQPVIDEDTGLLYVNTGNETPFFFVNYRPGPNLYGSSIIAIDMKQGKMKWWIQDAPRDPWDYDCNWSGMLIDDAKLGKVYVKGCKIGFLHVLDAATGKHIHYIDTRVPGETDAQMGPLRNPLIGMAKPMDPMDKFQMKEFSIFKEYPNPKDLLFNPGFFHGSFGSDPSYHDGTIFHFVQTSTMIGPTTWGFPENPDEAVPGKGYTYGTALPGNTTLVARDLVTGKVKWTYFYKYTNVRGFPIITGNMVVMGNPDGNVRFIDESNGKLLRTLNLGASMGIGLTAGKDSDGNSRIFALVGTSGAAGYDIQPSSGTLVALGLTDKASSGGGAVQATTTTVTTTQSTTITESGGIPAEVTYAAVGVAIITIIAAALVVMRKKQ